MKHPIVAERIDRTSWDLYWPQVFRAPLYQSWEYGEAKRWTSGCRVARFALRRREGDVVALAQALHYSLPLAGGVARINSGPAFLHAIGPGQCSTLLEAAVSALLNEWRRRRWWTVRFAPNASRDELRNAMADLAGVERTGDGWASATVDLARGDEELIASLHGKWRNLLRKSERQGLEFEVAQPREGLEFLLPRYRAFQQEKGFIGHSKRLLDALFRQEGPRWHPRVLFARRQDQRVGGIIVLGHGDTCTYLAGWTPSEGRELNCNYFLLWNAILHYRQLAYRYFDVGGLSKQTPPGIAHFKRGLQGAEYELAGEYKVVPHSRRPANRISLR